MVFICEFLLRKFCESFEFFCFIYHVYFRFFDLVNVIQLAIKINIRMQIVIIHITVASYFFFSSYLTLNSNKSRTYSGGLLRSLGAVRERRHGIVLREDTGTVAYGFFYTRGLLPRGTRFPLEMELDIDNS